MELVCEAAVTLNDLKQCASFMSSKILESGFSLFFFLVYNEYFGGNFGGSFCLSKALTFFFLTFYTH